MCIHGGVVEAAHVEAEELDTVVADLFLHGVHIKGGVAAASCHVGFDCQVRAGGGGSAVVWS